MEEWSVRSMFMATLAAVAVGLAFLLVYRFYMVVFLLFAAIALQMALDPVVRWFFRRGIPKETGMVLIYTLLFGLVGTAVWFATPMVVNQGQTAFKDILEYYQSLRTNLLHSPLGLVRILTSSLPVQPSLGLLFSPSGSDPAAETNAVLGAAPGLYWINAAGQTLFVLIAILSIAFYWAREGEVILRRLVLHAPPAHREEVRAFIAEIQNKIGAYIHGQSILSLVVGGMSFVAFLLIGVPNAVLLGVIMGLFEAVPVIGPTLGAIPAILMTLAVAPAKALWVIGALIGIQLAENNLLVPRVMDESVGVNAIVSMLAIAAFGVLFGIGGAILAIPLAAIIQIILNRILFNTPISEEAASQSLVTQDVSRSYLGVLRLKAQELTLDVRKLERAEERDDPANHEADPIADEVEAIAATLDQMLAQMEGVI